MHTQLAIFRRFGWYMGFRLEVRSADVIVSNARGAVLRALPTLGARVRLNRQRYGWGAEFHRLSRINSDDEFAAVRQFPSGSPGS